jgi:hypothetical protein
MVTRKTLCLTSLLALGACATSSQPQEVVLHVCPIAPAYTSAFEKSAAQELAALPPGSPLAQMIADYVAVRKEISVCSGR